MGALPETARVYPAGFAQVSPARVSVRYLASFSAEVDGIPVERWRAGKSRTCTQYLLLHHGKLLSRDHLHDVLWPDAEWSASSSSLKVACHGVRTALRASRHLAEPSATGVHLVHRDGGYALHVDDLWSDVEEVDALARAGLRHMDAGNSDAGRPLLERLVELYEGDFLAGQDDAWVVESREHYRAQVLRALDVLRADAFDRGDTAAVMSISRKALTVDGLHEPTYEALIRLHGDFGEPEQALRWFTICRDRLRGRLGVEPSERTLRTMHRVMNQGRGAGPATSTPATSTPATSTLAGVLPMPRTERVSVQTAVRSAS